jgi:hypothetical protein
MGRKPDGALLALVAVLVTVLGVLAGLSTRGVLRAILVLVLVVVALGAVGAIILRLNTTQYWLAKWSLKRDARRFRTWCQPWSVISPSASASFVHVVLLLPKSGQSKDASKSFLEKSRIRCEVRRQWRRKGHLCANPFIGLSGEITATFPSALTVSENGQLRVANGLYRIRWKLDGHWRAFVRAYVWFDGVRYRTHPLILVIAHWQDFRARVRKYADQGIIAS